MGLFDVFAISTGAMFSSGFFLLPGIASHYTGPSVFVAYLIAGFLIVPSMFSIAEIATAFPKAGGAYFFLDRSLGPLVGTIGGLGTYLALVFKTAFAIIGIGAYAALFWDVPVRLIAVSATMLFMGLNIVGVKKTSGLQKFLILYLLIVLGGFIFDGLYHIVANDVVKGPIVETHFRPFFTNGIEGVIVTSGFVFVSYLGLTKVASVAEEVKNPEKNIPVGMLLSLVVTSIIYFLGVFIMVALIEPKFFANDLAPAASAVEHLFHWMPGNTGTYLMVGAAMAAFASTGNAGLLSSSRYPFAMGRDKLLPTKFAHIGRTGAPVISIYLTTAFVLALVLFISEESIAKVASVFQLVIFMFINFAVIVFRKSKIESYDPGYRSPFFPAMQIGGIIISLVLIAYMGFMAILFSVAVILVSILWYYYYAKKRVKREGAIFHWFALLGKYQYNDLENEFMTILREKGLRPGDPFDETIVRAKIFYIDDTISFEELLNRVTESMAKEIKVKQEELSEEFLTVSAIEPTMILPEISILYGRIDDIKQPELHIVIANEGVERSVSKHGIVSKDRIRCFFFLINSEDKPKQQLRMLTRLIDIVERRGFVNQMIKMKSHREIKEYLLQSERFITLRLLPGTKQMALINSELRDLKLPSDVLVALVERDNQTFVPNGRTRLKELDTITIIGGQKSISQLFKKYISVQ